MCVCVLCARALVMIIVLARISNQTTDKRKIFFLMGMGRKTAVILADALSRYTNSNPFFTYCEVRPNSLLLFRTWTTHFEPFRRRRLFQSSFKSVLFLLDMMEEFQINLVLRSAYMWH